MWRVTLAAHRQTLSPRQRGLPALAGWVRDRGALRVSAWPRHRCHGQASQQSRPDARSVIGPVTNLVALTPWGTVRASVRVHQHTADGEAERC